MPFEIRVEYPNWPIIEVQFKETVLKHFLGLNKMKKMPVEFVSPINSVNSWNLIKLIASLTRVFFLYKKKRFKGNKN